MKTTEQIYKSNQKKAKIFKFIAPIVRWGLLALSILFFYLAIRNSLGNLLEITHLLNSKQYTGAELKANYDMLIDKYGKWHIGNGGAGFSIEFINIYNAVFSGVAITCFFLAVTCLISSFVFGKYVLPMIAKQINENNQDMVNMTILKDKR